MCKRTGTVHKDNYDLDNKNALGHWEIINTVFEFTLIPEA